MTYADMEADRRERLHKEQAETYRIMCAIPRAIFVFGSNRKGIHGAGAAKTAHVLYGAKLGQGEGLANRSYALPTKETPGRRLELPAIKEHVATFLAFAASRPDLTFVLTRVGCGMAGHVDEDIAPMFASAPLNILKPEGW